MNLRSGFFLFQSTLGLPLPLIGVFVAAFGAIIGSFLNVVIHRLPRGESIVFPNSRCPSCQALIRPFDNIPIISYLFLRGRCRNCRAPISARYPAVEALTALLFAALFLCDLYLRGQGWAVILFDLVFVSALLALVFIDAEHMLLPNAITYPGIVFAAVARLLLPYLAGEVAFDDLSQLAGGAFTNWPLWAVSLFGAVLGALAGGGSLWLMGWLWERLRGVEAMGLGDVKMMFMVGAYLGWRLTIVAIFLGVLSGSVAGIALMLRRGQKDMQMLLPFGIFLGIGSLISLFFGSRIVAWYASQF
ncbi:MAG TPA: prepilin peptidase [Pyrinomonadaceae bacterium]|jgi:leader peptidase (prepilin peptidase)/N-methyltransferase